MEGLLQDRGGVLRLKAITLKALPRFETAALSGFGLFFGVSVAWGHGGLLDSVWVFAVAVCPSAGHTYPRASVRTAPLLRHALLLLPAFFHQPCAV
jgi:hypothetical protein